MAADNANRLISRLVAERQIENALLRGVTADWFAVPEDRAVWSFLVRHHDAYGEVPTSVTVKDNYPTYRLLRVEDTSEYLLDQFAAHRRATKTYALVRDAVDALDNPNDYERVLGLLRAGLADVDAAVSSTNDMDLVVDAASRFAAYEDLKNRPGGLLGLPTGFPTIDEATAGLQPGQLVTIVASPKTGKAVRNDTRVLTPTGWTTMGDICSGDKVVGSDGLPTTVVAVHPQGEVDLYRVTTSDGVSVDACGDHLWQVRPYRRGVHVLNTRTLRSVLASGDRRFAYLPMTAPVRYPFDNEDLPPVDPYLLGLLLGDGYLGGGTPTFTKPVPEIHEEIAHRLPAGVSAVLLDPKKGSVSLSTRRGDPNPLLDALREMQLIGCRSWEKFIPHRYLYGPVSERVLLLQGLMDTDGGVEINKLGNARAVFSTSSERLSWQVQELVQSLGGTAKTSVKKSPKHQGGTGRPAHITTVKLPPAISPFLAGPKRRKWDAARARLTKSTPPVRRIVSIEPVGRGEATCITVDRPDGLFLTEGFVVTHNSQLALKVADHIHRSGLSTLYQSFEMGNAEQQQRFDALRARVSHNRLRRGLLTHDEEKRYRAALSEMDGVGNSFVLTDSSVATTVSALGAKIAQVGPDVAVVDGVYLMVDEVTNEFNTPQALTNITRSFKRLAQRLGIPIIITTQTLLWKMKKNEISENSIGYSSSFLQDSDVVIGLERTEDDAMRLLKVVASRNCGPAQVDCVWDWETGTFEEMSSAPAPGAPSPSWADADDSYDYEAS